MNKLLLLFTLAPCIAFGQTTLIPDANFEQALIDLGYDTGTPDGSVPTANISGVTVLSVYSENISDLTGIEDFTALTYLQCQYNELTSLDISNNTALDELRCYNNQLTSLDVSGCTALTWLDCDGNQLTSLDVSNNTALTTLSCGGNQLTSLDVSTNTALTYLSCSWNQLTSLDVSNNTALTTLACHDNQLTSLDVSGATALTWLGYWNNQLTSLDVSNNTELTVLYCDSNQLTSLDVSNNTALTALYCRANQLTCLNIKNGNNYNMYSDFSTFANPNLTCIEVDDSAFATAAWTSVDSIIDPQTTFSEDCNYPTPCGTATASWDCINNTCTDPGTGNGAYSTLAACQAACDTTATSIKEITKNKELLTITDILGRTIQPTPNTLLFYIYEDGSVEKKMQIER